MKKALLIAALLAVLGVLAGCGATTYTSSDGRYSYQVVGDRVAWQAQVEVPTPCHNVSSTGQVRDGLLVVSVETQGADGACAQVIDERRVLGETTHNGVVRGMRVVVDGERVFSTE